MNMKDKVAKQYNSTNIQLAYLEGRNNAYELGKTNTYYYVEIKQSIHQQYLKKL